MATKKIEECTHEELVTLLTFDAGPFFVVDRQCNGVLAQVTAEHKENGREFALANENGWTQKVLAVFESKKMDGTMLRKELEADVDTLCRPIALSVLPNMDDRSTSRNDYFDQLLLNAAAVLMKLMTCDARGILSAAQRMADGQFTIKDCTCEGLVALLAQVVAQKEIDVAGLDQFGDWQQKVAAYVQQKKMDGAMLMEAEDNQIASQLTFAFVPLDEVDECNAELRRRLQEPLGAVVEALKACDVRGIMSATKVHYGHKNQIDECTCEEIVTLLTYREPTFGRVQGALALAVAYDNTGVQKVGALDHIENKIVAYFIENKIDGEVLMKASLYQLRSDIMDTLDEDNQQGEALIAIEQVLKCLKKCNVSHILAAVADASVFWSPVPPSDERKQSVDRLEAEVEDEKELLAMPDLSIFKLDESQIEDTSRVQRLVQAAKMYQYLMRSSKDGRARFIEFCIASYRLKAMLDDHIHFVRAHSDDTSRRRIADLVGCCRLPLSECGSTARHNRNRQNDDSYDFSLYVEVMDSLHFTLFHLEQVGLRDVKKDDTSERFNNAFARIQKDRGRQKKDDGGKFVIAAQQEQYDGKATTNERMCEHIADHISDEAVKLDFYEFIAEEEFDSDAVVLDAAHTANSNLQSFGNVLSNALTEFLRIQRVNNASFDTGYLFFYWPWYKDQSDDIKQDREQGQSDYRGHTIAELFVSARFDSFKSEVLSSGLVSVNCFTEHIVSKVSAYKETAYAKTLRAASAFTRQMNLDPLHLGITANYPISAHHLHALVLYCDFSDWCFEFGKSFRKIKWNDSLNDIKKRNSKFYWASRYLREAVHYFGTSAFLLKAGQRLIDRGKDISFGPFFTGMKGVMNVPSFSMSPNGPTSTSAQPSVAARFAGDGGMIIVLDTRFGHNQLEHCFDCSWLSAFNEEDERFWFGSIWKMQVTTVLLIKSNRDYRRSISAFYKFDKMLSASSRDTVAEYQRVKLDEQVSVSKLDVTLVSRAIKSALCQPFPAHKILDQYALDNFFAFTRHKRQIMFDLRVLHSRNAELVGLVMHPIQQEPPSKDTVNVFKPFIFNLFVNLKHITISVDKDYQLNLLTLLSASLPDTLPPSFETLVIKMTSLVRMEDWGWLAHQNDTAIVARFAEKQLKVEFKELTHEEFGWVTERWVLISAV